MPHEGRKAGQEQCCHRVGPDTALQQYQQVETSEKGKTF